MNADIFKMLVDRNAHLKIKTACDNSFRKYGRVIRNLDFTPVVGHLSDNTLVPDDGNIYIASDDRMERLPAVILAEKILFGEAPAQAGYCNGRNSSLNGLEYHKASEINVAATPAVLLLGDVRDITEHWRYDSCGVEAFYLEAGQAVELYATTLHFAPCRVVEGGFKVAVLLPRGTNLPLEEKPGDGTGENRLLFAVNKWLLAHPERRPLIENGAWPGITGDNVTINPVQIGDCEPSFPST